MGKFLVYKFPTVQLEFPKVANSNCRNGGEIKNSFLKMAY
jgi:hypothetical protein